MKTKKILFCLVCGFIFGGVLAAQKPLRTEEPWHLLEQGKIAFEKGEFGEALLLIGEARNMRKKQVEKQYEYLLAAIKPYQVRAAGDLIADVYDVLQKREDREACAILDRIFLTHPPVFFDKSIKNLIGWFAKSGVYPECDYLIGKIYELEGEYSQAFIHYREAWDFQEFLYIPDMRFEIIYALSHISGLMHKYDDQEKYLLLILTEDPIYGTTNLESATLKAMIHTIKSEKDVEKFFSLYRHHNDIALRAYTELTEIYMRAEEYERAFRTAMIGADIAVTYLSDTVKKNDFMYTYSTFSDLLLRIGSNNQLLEWVDSRKIWEIFLQFADLLYRQQFVVQAQDLYMKMAEYCPSFEYAQEASYKLSQVL